MVTFTSGMKGFNRRGTSTFEADYRKMGTESFDTSIYLDWVIVNNPTENERFT